MGMTFTSLGKTAILKRGLNGETPADMKVILFTDNETISFASVLADLTEATEAGYARITLTPGSFTFSNPSASIIKAAYAKVTFSMTEVMTAYGFALISGSTPVLIAAEKFSDGPYVLGSAGGDVSVTLSLSID